MVDSHVRSLRFVSAPRVVIAVAVLAAGVALVGCDEGSTGGGDDGGTGGSSSSSSPSGGESCNLREDKWYSECDDGCGDVMVCQSFCSDCDVKCMVPCYDSSDCEAVGAGSCEESTYGSNRCSGAPTKCPGSSSDEPEGEDTSSASTGAGGSCSETGYSCTVNGDCCDFSFGGALCVDYGDGNGMCGATCTGGEQCNSGCCVGTDGGNSVCAPSEYCAG